MPARRPRSAISTSANPRSAWPCCSTSAAAWRSAATWTAPAKPWPWRRRTCSDGATKRRCSRSIRSLQEVVDFTKDLERIRRVSLKGKPWGMTSLYDAIGRRRGPSRAGEQASRAARDHRRRRHRQPDDAAAGVGDRQRDRRARVSADGRQPAGSPGRRVCGHRDRRATDCRRNAGGPGALDRRRHAHRERARAHGRRRCRTCSTELRHQYLDHLRAGDPSGLAPARDSDAEEEPGRSCAERVHRPGRRKSEVGS